MRRRVLSWDLAQGITEQLHSLKCNMVASVPVYFPYMGPGIVMHQEEPKTHCTSVESDNSSKDFILIPTGSLGAVGYPVGFCACLHGYASPPPNR